MINNNESLQPCVKSELTFLKLLKTRTSTFGKFLCVKLQTKSTLKTFCRKFANILINLNIKLYLKRKNHRLTNHIKTNN